MHVWRSNGVRSDSRWNHPSGFGEMPQADLPRRVQVYRLGNRKSQSGRGTQGTFLGIRTHSYRILLVRTRKIWILWVLQRYLSKSGRRWNFCLKQESLLGHFLRLCWSTNLLFKVIADVLLCPFEAVKVRIQTSKPGTFPTDFGAAFNKIKLEEGRK